MYDYPDINYYPTSTDCDGSNTVTVTTTSACANGTDDSPMAYGTFTEWTLYKADTGDDALDTDDVESLSSAQIAGITVGAVLGTCILCGLFAYFTSRRKSESNSKTPMSQQEIGGRVPVV
jgi:hypothetical protein